MTSRTEHDQPAGATAERRLVSALFADVVGSTSLDAPAVALGRDRHQGDDAAHYRAPVLRVHPISPGNVYIKLANLHTNGSHSNLPPRR
jgi:hypothetical protein